MVNLTIDDNLDVMKYSISFKKYAPGHLNVVSVSNLNELFLKFHM